MLSLKWKSSWFYASFLAIFNSALSVCIRQELSKRFFSFEGWIESGHFWWHHMRYLRIEICPWLWGTSFSLRRVCPWLLDIIYMSSCELTEHFLHNKRTHDFNNNVTITIIEQIRKDHLETDKKKEVLREREIFWQRTLNSFQPYGLNKRTG